MRTSTKLIIGIMGTGALGLLLVAGIALEWPIFSAFPEWMYWVGGAFVMASAFAGTGVGPIGKWLDRLLKDGQ